MTKDLSKIAQQSRRSNGVKLNMKNNMMRRKKFINNTNLQTSKSIKISHQSIDEKNVQNFQN